MATLLFYSATNNPVDLAVGSSSMTGDVLRIGCVDGASFGAAINRLNARGGRFDRVAINTHGSPGRVSFGPRDIDAAWFRNSAAAGLQPNFLVPGTRIYFGGCAVAAGPQGWDFLRAAAFFFLRTYGGQASAYTSLGLTNAFNGHIMHLWGDLRTIEVNRAGEEIRAQSS